MLLRELQSYKTLLASGAITTLAEIGSDTSEKEFGIPVL